MTHTPDLRDRVPQGSGTYDVNTSIEAGLPNLTGWAWPFSTTSGARINYGYGVFSVSGVGHGQLIAGATDDIPYTLNFDAENGRKYWHNQMYGNTPTDIIYGNSKTVQPPAFAVNFYIKAK